MRPCCAHQEEQEKQTNDAASRTEAIENSEDSALPVCCAAAKDNAAGSNDANVMHCPVETTLKLIGGKYKTLIVWNLFEGTLRFSQLHHLIPRATAKMLTQQLRELERDGLIMRRVYPVVPPKVEYSLSERGQSLRPVLKAIYAWGMDYLADKGMTANCGMKKLS